MKSSRRPNKVSLYIISHIYFPSIFRSLREGGKFLKSEETPKTFHRNSQMNNFSFYNNTQKMPWKKCQPALLGAWGRSICPLPSKKGSLKETKYKKKRTLWQNPNFTPPCTFSFKARHNKSSLCLPFLEVYFSLDCSFFRGGSLLFSSLVFRFFFFML